MASETALNIKSGNRGAFSDEEIEAFKALVVSEARVDKDSLPALIEAAPRLVALFSGDKIIGTAAIKTPNVIYRQRVFEKSDIQKYSPLYPQELGWVVVDSDHRRRGYSKCLVEAAISSPHNKGIYATSQDADVGMHKTLEQFGFEKSGTPYASKDRTKNILVFLLK